MKKKEWALKRLEQLAESELEHIKNHMILDDGDRYDVFNKYEIVKLDNNTYQVTKLHAVGKCFSALRLALSWCIADKYSNNALANSIQQLDEEKIRISNDLNTRQAILQKMKDPDRREITQVKIFARKQGLKLIENRLAKCVSLAKYCQIRGFNRDETARTRRTQQTR